MSIAAALGVDDEFVTEGASGHQSDYTLEGWTVQEWSEWGRRKSTIASTVARERGALRRRVIDLEEEIREMNKLPIEVAVNKIGAQSSDDVDPLCMLDPWCVTSNVQNTPYSATFGSDAWAHWKPQRVQFENFNSTRSPLGTGTQSRLQRNR